MSASASALQLEKARFNMVEQQVRTWDVLDYRVLEVLHNIPREHFVESEHAAMAYADTELPVPGASAGEKLFKPVIDGRILQAIGLSGDEDLLEIGSGSGYTSACLAKLARQVLCIDQNAAFCDAAAKRTKQIGLHNVRFEACALHDFKPKFGFDVIVVGGAVAHIPEQLRTWLNPGGRIFAVRGISPVMEAVLLKNDSKSFSTQSLFETDLPYLHGSEPERPKFSL